MTRRSAAATSRLRSAWRFAWGHWAHCSATTRSSGTSSSARSATPWRRMRGRKASGWIPPRGSSPPAPEGAGAESREQQEAHMAGTGLQLRSEVKSSGELELSLAEVPIPEPAADEVLVRVEATPINPSDLGLLIGPADISAAKVSGTPDRPVVTAPIPPQFMKALAARADQSLPVGNEGAGVVVAAGSSPQAQALMGRTVAMIGGAMYAQHR